MNLSIGLHLTSITAQKPNTINSILYKDLRPFSIKMSISEKAIM